MDISAKRKKIADDVFTATGAKVDGHDPLVTAALFYSKQMCDAGEAVSIQLQHAVVELKAAAQLATTTNSVVLADRVKLLKDVEAQIVGADDELTQLPKFH